MTLLHLPLQHPCHGHHTVLSPTARGRDALGRLVFSFLAMSASLRWRGRRAIALACNPSAQIPVDQVGVASAEEWWLLSSKFTTEWLLPVRSELNGTASSSTAASLACPPHRIVVY